MSTGRRVPSSTVLGVILNVGLLLVVTYVLTGFPIATDYDQLLDRGVFPDVIHERATAWEAIWGNPYRPLSEIMPEHGYEMATAPAAPRPPSALLLQTPLILISPGFLMPTVLVVILLLLLWIGWLVCSISGIEPWKLMLATPLVLISLPVISTLSYSPLFAVLTVALILTSWKYQDRPWTGILIGMAAGLRLWPGLVILGFWLAGRRRLAFTALGTFVVLNAIGLLLPGIDLTSSLGSLTDTTEYWMNNNMNFSLALVLWPYGVPPTLATVLAASIGAWAAFRNRANAVPITIAAAVIASPLSWPAYALVVLPVVALCVRRLSRFAVLAVSVPLALWNLLPSRWIGHAHFLALAVLFILLVTRPRIVSHSSVGTVSEPFPSIVT